ncbi:unnamed protein product, partial [Darwinula stevensoni]
MIEWEEPDKVSSGLYDSDHFEDDSLCSWNSEQEVVITNNWRGWRGPPTSTPTTSQASTYNRSTHILSVLVIADRSQLTAWSLFRGFFVSRPSRTVTQDKGDGQPSHV